MTLTFYQHINVQSKYGEPSHSPLSILSLTIHHRHQRTNKSSHNCRRNNPCRVHTSILTSVRNHIHWYQLQGRNIQNQKCAHLITRSRFRPSCSMGAKAPCVFPAYLPSPSKYAGFPLSSSSSSIAFSPPCVKLMTRTF